MSYKFVPSACTAANLVAGMLALISTLNGQVVQSVVLILAATIFDLLDGRLARRFDTTSAFGKELDSLADLVSFGVAPALLAYTQELQYMGPIGIVLTVTFALCGALRLARFNVLNISGYFLGIPITAAGALLALLVPAANALPEMVLPLIVAILAWLMISRIKFPKY